MEKSEDKAEKMPTGIHLSDFSSLFQKDPAQLSDRDLLFLDFLQHSASRHTKNGDPIPLDGRPVYGEELVKAHFLVRQEMDRREFRHALNDELDQKTQARLHAEESPAPMEPAGPGEQDEWLPGDESRELEKSPFYVFGRFTGRVFDAVLKALPEHKTYVEPFCGPAQFLHAKDLSETEVLADKDKKIVLLHRTIRDLTEADFSKLAGYPWGKLSKSHFKELAQKEFDDPVHELWRIIVLKRNSIGGGLNFAEKSHYRNEPIPDFRDRALKRLRRANERLKNVKVHQADFEKTIKDWDGPDTVFLIDPPYFERDEYYNLGFSLADIKRLCKALKSIKGKFILLHTKSQGFDLARELSDFHCHSFRWESPIQHMSREGGLEVEKRRLLVIWNFGSPALVKETLPAEPSPGEDAVSPEVSVAKRNEIALEDLDWQDEEPVEFEKLRGAFKSPGGKYHLFKKILAHVPEHEVYVEPFCGGAQVFFHKVRSAEEVISDIDNDLIFSYRFIKSMTPQDLEWLKQQAWVIAKRQAKRLFKRRPASRRQRFYRFAYLNKATYLGKAHVWSTPRTVGPSGAGARIGLVERLSEIQERLKGVRIHCWDWKETIARYDSPDTFFYLDPPYAIHWPKEDGHLEGKFFDEREMVPALKRIRGKFILSYEMEKARLFKGFKIHRVKTLWTLARHEGTRSKYELLVSNFPLKPVDLYLEKDGRAREKEAGASDLPTEKAVNP